MKKKKLKNLILHKHKISNLSLYKQFGGLMNTETETETETNQGMVSIQIACPTLNGETCLQTECDSNCGTNGGTIKAPPPTEYNTCNCTTPGF